MECQDNDNGKTDKFGFNCKKGYNKYPEDCGKYDDDDFFAKKMCCACKGTLFWWHALEMRSISLFRKNIENGTW